MNYEEMLNKKEGAAIHKEPMTIGAFYKKRIENKYRNVVELRPDLANSLLFCEGLKRDQATGMDIRDAFQLHYTTKEDSGGIYELEVNEPGNYQPLSQVLATTPAVVAERGFIDEMVERLMTATEKLHQKEIYHLCFAPEDIFIRKNDRQPLLLFHGSSFQSMRNSALLYKGFEEMVAPEVLNNEGVDARTDVFALGCFIRKLHDSGSMSMEYKQVVKKATAEDPLQRFQSVDEMRKAIAKKRGFKRSAIFAGTAVAIVLVLLFLFFDLMPQSANVEFIDQTGLVAVDHYAEDVMEDTFTYDPNEYIDPDQQEYLDSLGVMTGAELDALLDSVGPIANAEELFRRQFTPQVEAKMSELYSQQQLGSSQSDFLAHSQNVMDELMETALTLGERCDMTEEQTTLLADQIIARIQAAKQSTITRYGSMTQSQDEE